MALSNNRMGLSSTGRGYYDHIVLVDSLNGKVNAMVIGFLKSPKVLFSLINVTFAYLVPQLTSVRD